jgi:hypothetical protein
MAYERGGDFLEDARKILNRESERAAAKPFFHRLRPPDKHHEI